MEAFLLVDGHCCSGACFAIYDDDDVIMGYYTL
jgi:hypothetical protein